MNIALIIAGGKGVRMNQEIPKQFLTVYDKPVIAFAGCVTEEASACNGAGIDAFFPILRGVVTLEDAMNTENAKHNLEKTAEQAFRLIRAFR